MKKILFTLIFFCSYLQAITLHIEGEGRSWETTVNRSDSVDVLTKNISKSFGIPAQFLVLYKDDPPYFERGIDLRLHPSRRIEDMHKKNS